MISCNWAKDKAKKGVNKTGEVVAEAGSEFADGVRKGVDEAFSNAISLDEPLKAKGLTLGRTMVKGTDSSSDNIVTAYFIFEKDFKGKLTAKAVDDKGLEFGRASVTITATTGDAGYYDFIFDNRTNIDRKDKVIIY
jgi:hypothetical protein